METVGFIGLGNMGSGIAKNIQRAGYTMVLFDINADAIKNCLNGNARLAGSPAEVAHLSDVVFTSLPGPAEVNEVVNGSQGILMGIRKGGIYVDLSTISPTLIRQIEPLFRLKRAHVLDAPVSGGKAGAAMRNLAVMVGGDPDTYEHIKPILDSFGDKVFYAGNLGAGSICKLVHNMIGRTVRQAIAEGLTLGVKAGVDPEPLWENVRRGSLGRMGMLHEEIPRAVFRGQFDPATFSLDLARKDIGLANELAREYNVPIPMASIAEQIAIQGINRGWGDKDSTVTFLLQEEMAGVTVRAQRADPQKY